MAWFANLFGAKKVDEAIDAFRNNSNYQENLKKDPRLTHGEGYQDISQMASSYGQTT